MTRLFRIAPAALVALLLGVFPAAAQITPGGGGGGGGGGGAITAPLGTGTSQAGSVSTVNPSGYVNQTNVQQVGGTAVAAPGSITTSNFAVPVYDPTVNANITATAAPIGSAAAPATGSTPALTAQAPFLPILHSTALEACHVFTKGASTSGMRSLSAKAASASALYLELFDLAAAPTSGSSNGSTLITPGGAIKLGSDGTYVQGYIDFTGAPVTSTTGFVACLSSTDAPVYTAVSAIGWYTAQVP